MHPLSPTENAPSLLDAAQVLETITDELNTQEADAECNASEIQGHIDALEKETVRHRGTITATHTERERRVVAVHEEGQGGPEVLQSELEEPPYELDVVNSLTLVLPHELMAEIFNWHMLMGGRQTTPLLVCKRWTMVVYSSPRLWSRVFVTDHPRGPRYLRGSVICTDLNHIRLVLSRSQSCRLQIAISFLSDAFPYLDESISSASLMHGPQATANRIEAAKLILGDQVLRRCTALILANQFLPFDYQNVTVLPLLSSIRTHVVGRRGRGILFIQSLVDLSPALRHIHCHHSLSAENKGVGLWTKRIESYSWIFPFAPCYPLHESPSLRKLGICGDPVTPLTLPALQILKWSIGSYSSLHRITAPHLHSIILGHRRRGWQSKCGESTGSISFPNLRVAVHNLVSHPKVLHMFHTPALEHLSIEYRSSDTPPAALLELFDGSTHMPTPKSIHLDCTFTDDTLIAVLGRLPWLEELQVAGTAVRDTFWKRLTPSCNPICQVSLTESPTDQPAPDLLVPNLKVLLVHYPKATAPTPNQKRELENVSKDPDEFSSGREWELTQASEAVVAREQAECPFRTLACWFPEHKVEVLIGSLDNLPRRPEFVSLTARWCC